MLFMLCIYSQILLRGGHSAQHTCLHAVPAGRGDQERGTDELLEESGQSSGVDIVMKIYHNYQVFLQKSSPPKILFVLANLMILACIPLRVMVMEHDPAE